MYALERKRQIKLIEMGSACAARKRRIEKVVLRQLLKDLLRHGARLLGFVFEGGDERFGALTQRDRQAIRHELFHAQVSLDYVQNGVVAQLERSGARVCHRLGELFLGRFLNKIGLGQEERIEKVQDELFDVEQRRAVYGEYLKVAGAGRVALVARSGLQLCQEQ